VSGERTASAKDGFTLVEVLTALAIASVILMSTAALMHNVALSFDRGTNRVSAGERLALASERLAADIGSARFVLQGAAPAARAAFLGEPGKITFIGVRLVDPASRPLGGAPAPEVVSVGIEAGEATTALVRRSGAWRDPRLPFTNVVLGDEVVLVAGRFDAAFTFARISPTGALTWSSSWTAEQTLPRLVKLSLRDRASGIDLLGGGEFLVRADASRACARERATVDCLANPAGASETPKSQGETL
jgi:prepilin-type N-terminal cleavage/methylation domain-containing protein